MRFYSLVISDPTTGKVWQPTKTGNGFVKAAGGATFSSLVGGQTTPGALNIEFDIPVVPFHTLQGGASIIVWGVGIGMISQATNLNGANFELSGGMQKGLELAKPEQSGLLANGLVFQAFGNWEGLSQTLELVCLPGAAVNAKNLHLAWPPGTQLSVALNTCLRQAFPAPDYSVKVAISQNLAQASDGSGHYQSLGQLASYVNEISQRIGGPKYQGVSITATGSTILAFDGTVPVDPAGPKQLQFEDLIGQPTWLGPLSVSLKTVMRGHTGRQSGRVSARRRVALCAHLGGGGVSKRAGDQQIGFPGLFHGDRAAPLRELPAARRRVVEHLFQGSAIRTQPAEEVALKIRRKTKGRPKSQGGPRPSSAHSTETVLPCERSCISPEHGLAVLELIGDATQYFMCRIERGPSVCFSFCIAAALSNRLACQPDNSHRLEQGSAQIGERPIDVFGGNWRQRGGRRTLALRAPG